MGDVAVRKGEQLVAVVDRLDNVLHVTERRRADTLGLRMRTARTIILDPDERIWVHRRALQKPVNGGMYDVGIGETPLVSIVGGGYEHESYERAARRGVSEEVFDGCVSIDDVVVEHIAMLPPVDIPGSPRNYDVFAFCYDQSCHCPITPESEEVEGWWWKTVPELQEMLMKEKFMGIAPVIAQLALRVIRNQRESPVHLKGVYQA